MIFHGSISIIVGATGMHSTVFNNDCAVKELSIVNSDELKPIFVSKHEKRNCKRNREMRKVDKSKRLLAG